MEQLRQLRQRSLTESSHFIVIEAITGALLLAKWPTSEIARLKWLSKIRIFILFDPSDHLY
jgi:hypothetical protein